MRLGFIGVGSIAKDHLLAAKALGAQVTALCNRSKDSSKRREFCEASGTALQMYEDPAAFLRESDVDRIIVCLPWDITEKYLATFLHDPRPFLLEKPPCLQSAPLRTLLARQDVFPANKWVAFNRRFYKPVQELKERIRKGGLQQITVSIPEQVTRLLEKYGAKLEEHLLAYSASHALDLLHYFVGEVKISQKHDFSGQKFLRFRELLAVGTTRDDALLLLEISADAPENTRIRCRFADGTIWELCPLEKLQVYQGMDVIHPSATQKIRAFTPHVIHTSHADATYKPGLQEQLREFLQASQPQIGSTLGEFASLLAWIECLSS